MMQIVAIASDHAGFDLKTELAEELAEAGYEVKDLGTDSLDSVDYPDFGEAVGLAVADGDADWGVCVCGSGLGISMAANKVSGIRAAPISDATAARLARQHNDANVACFGARLLEAKVAKEALQVFAETDFEGGRHEKRIAKLADLDAK